ncbi:MAG: hypothetical protein MRJ96_03750 [Nitrospirales bacterium]|nr:hypothetical protein [Nitrospirales bacterium]
MPHFGGPGIGTLSDQWYPEGLLAVRAIDFHRVRIRIDDVLFFDPEQQAAFGTLSHEHRHKAFSIDH